MDRQFAKLLDGLADDGPLPSAAPLAPPVVRAIVTASANFASRWMVSSW